MQLPDAVAAFDRLILLNPGYDGPLSNRSICKLFLKDKEGACQDFAQSIAMG